jgi:hypothetical protein
MRGRLCHLKNFCRRLRQVFTAASHEHTFTDGRFCEAKHALALDFGGMLVNADSQLARHATGNPLLKSTMARLDFHRIVSGLGCANTWMRAPIWVELEKFEAYLSA